MQKEEIMWKETERQALGREREMERLGSSRPTYSENF
jgi:hypothetical protein